LEELDVLSVGLEASPGAWKSFPKVIKEYSPYRMYKIPAHDLYLVLKIHVFGSRKAKMTHKREKAKKCFKSAGCFLGGTVLEASPVP
jgi:hypothetical protein